MEEIERDLPVKGFFIMSEDNRFICRDKFKSLVYRIAYKMWNFFQGVYRELPIVSKEQFYEIIDSGKAKKIMVFLESEKEYLAFERIE